MVSSYQGDSIWIADFEAEEEEEAFKRVESAVHEIAHEEVVGFRHISSHPKELHEVVELAVYVAAYCDWSIDLNDVSFFDQQLACFVAEVADGRFGDGFASS